MKRFAVLIRDAEKQEDAMRTIQGLNDRGNRIELFVLEHDLEIFSDLFTDKRELLDEITGCYTDNPLNSGQFNFQYVTGEAMAMRLKEADLIIPF